jgi:hypothetical protein
MSVKQLPFYAYAVYDIDIYYTSRRDLIISSDVRTCPELRGRAR